MKKYLIYRAPKEIDRDLSKHELVGVEYGEDIYAATDTIIRAVTDYLSGNPEYAGCHKREYSGQLRYYRTGRLLPSKGIIMGMYYD